MLNHPTNYSLLFTIRSKLYATLFLRPVSYCIEHSPCHFSTWTFRFFKTNNGQVVVTNNKLNFGEKFYIKKLRFFFALFWVYCLFFVWNLKKRSVSWMLLQQTEKTYSRKLKILNQTLGVGICRSFFLLLIYSDKFI